MATTTVDTSVLAGTDDVGYDRDDVVVGYDLSKDKDGNVERVPNLYMAETDTAKGVNKLITEGEFEEVYRVTVATPRAKTLAGITSICPDVNEACGCFNRGAKQKGANRRNAKLLDVDADGVFTFDPTTLPGGVFDLTEEIASETKRKVLSEEEKLDRFLSTLPEAVRNSMKAAYMASLQTV